MTIKAKRMTLAVAAAATFTLTALGDVQAGGLMSHPVAVTRFATVSLGNRGAQPSGAGGGQGKYTCGHHRDCDPHYPPYHYYGPPGPLGTQSGNDPRGPNRGPGNPVLHPK
jgi:hypothetical protein